MMLRLSLLGLLAVCLVRAEYFNTNTADKSFLLKQKKVYNLLFHISQPTVVNQPLYYEGKQWNIEANIDSYTNTAAVKDFLYIYENGMLPRGELFSVFYPKQLAEMKALFKLFYYAKDFNSFYNTALWARIYINEAQFVFALYNAVIRRPDTKYIQLPAPYEMYPYAYFNAEVLEKAHHVKIFGKTDTKTTEGYETYIIPANYSGWYLNREYDMENKLNYFVEDIGLNSYYFFFRQDSPFWLNTEEFDLPNYRGEEFLYGHKQLLNRYNLERFANNLPRIEDFDWQKEFYPGYYPSMTFHNGLPYPQRPQWSRFPIYKYKYITEINNLESRISSMIDSGLIIDKEGKIFNMASLPNSLNILGNLIEGNPDSYSTEYFGSIDNLGRKILGFNPESTNNYQAYPSALESYSSSMRDPAFYRLYNRILSFYYRYKMRQQPYAKDEIIFPSLKIESFTVDKLITYFDEFDTSINNGMLVENQKEAETMLIKIRQYRLNHKPFSFHIAINSDKPTKAAIRIFLGPKYDTRRKLMELPENLKYFYEIDNMILDLNAGLNKVVRKSQDLFFVSPDPEPSEMFYQRVLKSLDSSEPFTYNQRIYGFPDRLILPKGRREGMPFELFLYVSPVSSEFTYSSRIWGDYKFDNKTYGFPLDRPLYDFKYDGPNMMFKDISIYHKDELDVNITY